MCNYNNKNLIKISFKIVIWCCKISGESKKGTEFWCAIQKGSSGVSVERGQDICSWTRVYLYTEIFSSYFMDVSAVVDPPELHSGNICMY